MKEDVQVLYHMPVRRIDEDRPNSALDEQRRALDAYSYADVLARWTGDFEGRFGTYFVLQGSEGIIDSTIERLQSGLYFALTVKELS